MLIWVPAALVLDWMYASLYAALPPLLLAKPSSWLPFCDRVTLATVPLRVKVLAVVSIEAMVI
ncbi:hypothetical protein D3C80_1763370 [compost metagenome]